MLPTEEPRGAGLDATLALHGQGQAPKVASIGRGQAVQPLSAALASATGSTLGKPRHATLTGQIAEQPFATREARHTGLPLALGRNAQVAPIGEEVTGEPLGAARLGRAGLALIRERSAGAEAARRPASVTQTGEPLGTDVGPPFPEGTGLSHPRHGDTDETLEIAGEPLGAMDAVGTGLLLAWRGPTASTIRITVEAGAALCRPCTRLPLLGERGAAALVGYEALAPGPTSGWLAERVAARRKRSASPIETTKLLLAGRIRPTGGPLGRKLRAAPFHAARPGDAEGLRGAGLPDRGRFAAAPLDAPQWSPAALGRGAGLPGTRSCLASPFTTEASPLVTDRMAARFTERSRLEDHPGADRPDPLGRGQLARWGVSVGRQASGHRIAIDAEPPLERRIPQETPDPIDASRPKAVSTSRPYRKAARPLHAPTGLRPLAEPGGQRTTVPLLQSIEEAGFRIGVPPCFPRRPRVRSRGCPSPAARGGPQRPNREHPNDTLLHTLSQHPIHSSLRGEGTLPLAIARIELRRVAGHADRVACPHHSERPDPEAARTPLARALLLTLSFMSVEVLVGLWSGSLALLADAGHMLNDASALGVALFVARMASRPRTTRKTYGYRRAEVLGALLNAAMLLGAAALVVHEAIERLADPPVVRGMGVVVTAVLGLLVNLAAVWILTRGGARSINVRAALFHVLGDAIGSVAALLAGLAIHLGGWRLADPLASMAIAALLVLGSLRLLMETVHVLMEGIPPGLDAAEVERTIRETPGVAEVHDLHLWALTPEAPVLTAHVVIQDEEHGVEVVARVRDRLHRLHGIGHVTVQPERPLPAEGLVPLDRLRVGGRSARG